MRLRIGAFGCFFLVMTGVVAGQKPTYLGYADQEGAGCVFLGWYYRGRFVPAPQLASSDPDRNITVAKAMLDEFPLHRPLAGIDRFGRPLSIVVDEVNPEPELGFSAIDISLQSGSPDSDAFFSTGVLPLRVIKSRNSSLTPQVALRLRKRARELWLRHLPERAADERPASFTLGKLTVQRVDGAPGFLTALFPVDIVEVGGGHDDRASFFFIYSENDHRIVYGKFGHPEWAPASSVLTVKPKFFFQVGSNPEVFFVGSCVGGWEEWGHAIYELRTGRRILLCY